MVSGVLTTMLYALALYLANAIYGIPNRGIWYLGDLLLAPFDFPFYLAGVLCAGWGMAFVGAVTAHALALLHGMMNAHDGRL